MFTNLLCNNDLNNYYICLSSGLILILSCSWYYCIRSNNMAIPTTNMEPFTNEEIEAIINENAVTVMNNDNTNAITDSDSDTESDITSDYARSIDSDATYDTEGILNDPDLLFRPSFESKFRDVEFIMPDVDLDICPIEELKLFEFCSLYSKEMADHLISEADMMDIICLFPARDLATNWINDLLLAIINIL